MNNYTKFWKILRKIIFILFIFYLINFFVVESGFYKSETTKKTILTEEKIAEFENDVKNGTFVDIKDYTEEEYVDTSNKIDDIGYEIGQGIHEIINNKVIKFFKKIGELFS